MRAGLRTVALLPRRLDFWGITTGFRHDTSSSSADDLSIAVQLLRDSVTICVAPPSPRMAELQERKQTLAVWGPTVLAGCATVVGALLAGASNTE